MASPLKKPRFRLSDGHCFDNPAMSVQSYPVEVRDQRVWSPSNTRPRWPPLHGRAKTLPLTGGREEG